MARISAGGRARRAARKDRTYLIELLDTPFLYLAQAADGAIIWTSDHDKARRFADAAAAQAFADEHVAGVVRIVGHR